MFVKQPWDQNTWESALASSGTRLIIRFTLRGTEAREANASEGAEVLPGEGPGPQALDLIQLPHSVQEESAPEPASGIQPRRCRRAAKKDTVQHGDQDKGDPGGDERVEPDVQDDLLSQRHLEVPTWTLRFSDENEGGRPPRDRGGGQDQEAELQDNLHEDVERLQEPEWKHVLAAARRALQLGATATESRRGSLPHLLRTHVAEDGGQGSDPAAAAHRHIVGNARTHADLAAALEVHRADMQLLPHPPGHGDMGSGLDGHIVPDGEEVQWSGKSTSWSHWRLSPTVAPSRRNAHAMSGALRIVVLSGRRTDCPSCSIHQVSKCTLLHLG